MKQPKAGRIIVLGRISTALTVLVESAPKPKEQIIAKSAAYTPGGKGANQAVAASRLGGKVSFVTCLGMDHLSKELLSFLKRERLDTSLVKFSKKTPAGMSIVMLDKNSDNTIISIPGSENDLLPDDVRSINFTNQDIAVSQFALPEDVVYVFIKKAKDSGATTVLNTAPRVKYGRKIFELSDYVIANESEAAFFVGSSKVSQDHNIALGYAKKLRLRHEQTVVVTLGGNGSITLSGNDSIRVPGIKVNVVDTQGAGDTFVGAFATALSERMKLKEAIEFANKAASISVQRHGAASSCPTRKEVEKI